MVEIERVAEETPAELSPFVTPGWIPGIGIGNYVSQQITAKVEIVITDDLPNGPYGEMAGMVLSYSQSTNLFRVVSDESKLSLPMNGKMYIGEQSNYTDFANALIAAWNES